MRNPALLLCQVWVLAAIAGVFASRYWEPGLVCLALLCWLQWGRIFGRGWRCGFLFLVVLAAAFGLGWGYAALREPVLPSQPEWLLEARSPTARHLELERELESLGGAPKTLWEAADNSRPDDSQGIAREGVYRKGLRFRARVVEVEGRVDRQLRLLLEGLEPVPESFSLLLEDDQALERRFAAAEAQVRPLDGGHGLAEGGLPGEGEALPVWPGRLVFTWHKPATPEGFRPDPPGTAALLRRAPLPEGELLPARPLPGQIIELSLKLREIRSLRNHGLWETESYWADRGANIRAWESGPAPRMEIIGNGNWAIRLYTLREGWRQGVLAALPKIAVAPKGNSDQSLLISSATEGVLADTAQELALAPGAELIPALLFGDKYLLDGGDSELFARSTLAHSLALSGLHLGYAAALGYFAVSLLYRVRPSLALRLPRQKAAVLGGALPALAYLWVGGAPPSLLRAFLMLAFVGWALFRNRPLVLADALIWAVASILLLNPLALFDLRLQLSALCIAALAWAQPLFSLLNARLKPSGSTNFKFPWRFLRGLALILLSSLVIQVVLAPILIKSFGVYGLAMPLNALWLPVLGLVVMPCAFLGLICVVLGLPMLSEFFFTASAWPCSLLLELLRWLDSSGGLLAVLPLRPHWLAMLGYWILLSQLPAAFKYFVKGDSTTSLPVKADSLPDSSGSPTAFGLSLRRVLPELLRSTVTTAFRSKLGQAILLPCRLLGGFQYKSATLTRLSLGLAFVCLPLLVQLGLNSRDAVELRLLDVGQGQGILVEWKGKRLLLDGGGGTNPRFDLGREVVAATLAHNRWPSLDYMLATHLDQDHAQGLVFPLRHMKVGWYADNGEPPRTRLSEEIIGLLGAQGLERNSLLDGDVLDLGHGLVAEVLFPAQAPGEGPKEANRNSLVVRFVWQGKGLFLACGDIDATAQRAILRRKDAATLKAEVLILPHHGSGNSLLPEFYQAVQPRLALSSSGYGNTWNFPAPRVKNALLEQGIPLLNTARAGQVRVLWKDGGEPEISTARWGRLELE